MRTILFLSMCILLLQSCQEEVLKSGTYVSDFKLTDHAKYKWLGSYRLAGKDSLILKDDGNYEFHTLCSESLVEGKWTINQDTVHLHGDYSSSIPHFYVLNNKRLYGKSKLGSETKLMRILAKFE